MIYLYKPPKVNEHHSLPILADVRLIIEDPTEISYYIGVISNKTVVF